MPSCWDVEPSLSKALREKSCKPAFNVLVENDARQWSLARWRGIKKSQARKRGLHIRRILSIPMKTERARAVHRVCIANKPYGSLWSDDQDLAEAVARSIIQLLAEPWKRPSGHCAIHIATKIGREKHEDLAGSWTERQPGYHTRQPRSRARALDALLRRS